MTAIEIGRVIKPHGLAGEVKVRLHWEESDALDNVEAVIVRREGRADAEITIESLRGSSNGLLLKLAGHDDRDAAEELRGAALLVAREALGSLEPGEFFLCDLVGAEVLGPDGAVGRVVEVRSHPTADAIVVRLEDGRLAEQVLGEPWLESVDVENQRVVLTTLEGLI